MPSINDRIGSQNVIRVLSNASAPPSRLLNLTDVESTSQIDGNLLIWDTSTSKFVMGRDLDGTEGYVFTGGTGQVGIVTFSGTTQSESTTTGAVIISGGLAVGKNANFAAGLNVVGIATFSNEIDINAAVDILRGLNVAGVTSVASLNIGATQVISSGRELQNIASLDATTTATIEAAIEVAPNTFTDLKISGVSTFIGIATYAAGIQVVSGVSTFDVAVDINAGLDVDGQTDLDEVVIAGVTTFNNADVVFQGAAAGQNITFDASENDLEFTDNARIKFGNNDDLEIWHDGTNSNIKNSTGDFHIRSDSLALKTADNSERYLKATKNEDVKLYYNGNEKFATTAEGVDITGRTETDLLNVSGVSTFAGLIDANARLDVVGGANLDQLNVAGIATLGAVDINGIIDIDGQLDVDELVVAGVSTFNSAVDINAGLDVDGQLDADELVVAGVATFSSAVDINAGLDVDGQTDLDELIVAGVSTFSSVVDINAGLDVDGDTQLDDLNVAGVATFSSNVNVSGASTFTGLMDANGGINATTVRVEDLTENRIVIVGGAGTASQTQSGVALTSVSDDGLNLTTGTNADISMIGNHPAGPNYASAENRNPSVSWDFNVPTLPTGVTIGSYSVLLEDLRAVDGNGDALVHWSVSGIAATITSLPANATANDITNASATINNNFNMTAFGQGVGSAGVSIVGYSGPQPATNENHIYRLSVTAQLSGGSTGTLTQGIEFNFNTSNTLTGAPTPTTAAANNLAFVYNLAGSGELEDDANLTFDGSTLSVGVALDVDGDTQVDDLNVAGVATFSSLIDANNRLDVVGGANLDQLNVTGVSTLTGNVSFGTSAFFGDNDKINMGDNDDLQIYHVSNGTGIIQNAGSGQLQLRSDTIRLLNQATDEDFAFFRDDGAVELYYNNTKRFETSGVGVTVYNQLDATDLNISGVSTFGGVSTFNDDVRITAGGLDVVGVATFSTNVNVTGTLDAGLIDGGTY